MPVVLSCSHCQTQVSVPEHALGKAVRCPVCGEAFVATAPSAAEPARVAAVTAELPARAAAPAAAPAASPWAEPTAAAPAQPAPVPAFRTRPTARSCGRKPLPWLIAASAGLGLAAVIGVVLLLVRNRADDPKAEDRLPDNLWREVKNEHGLFRVLLPGTPQIQQAAPGFTMTGVEMDNNHHGFFIGYGDIPDAEMHRIPLEQRFDTSRDRLALRQKGGRVLSERKITLDGHAGREVECEVPEGVVGGQPQMSNLVARFVGARLKGKVRFYVVLAAGAGYRADGPEIRKFLDSFRPLPEPAGAPADKGPPGAKDNPARQQQK
jgi:hypothetical protein